MLHEISVCVFFPTDNRIEAKAACDWGRAEERYFGLELKWLSPEVFFGVAQLPGLDDLARGVLQYGLAHDAREEGDADACRFLELMEEAVAGAESDIDDFAQHILTVMGFRKNRAKIKKQKRFDFWMCRTKKTAKADICVMDDLMGIDAVVLHHVKSFFHTCFTYASTPNQKCW